jgi:hypothetical protein
VLNKVNIGASNATGGFVYADDVVLHGEWPGWKLERGEERRWNATLVSGVKAELVLAAIQVLERMWSNFELGIRKSR